MGPAKTEGRGLVPVGVRGQEPLRPGHGRGQHGRARESIPFQAAQCARGQSPRVPAAAQAYLSQGQMPPQQSSSTGLARPRGSVSSQQLRGVLSSSREPIAACSSSLPQNGVRALTLLLTQPCRRHPAMGELAPSPTPPRQEVSPSFEYPEWQLRAGPRAWWGRCGGVWRFPGRQTGALRVRFVA